MRAAGSDRFERGRSPWHQKRRIKVRQAISIISKVGIDHVQNKASSQISLQKDFPRPDRIDADSLPAHATKCSPRDKVLKRVTTTPKSATRLISIALVQSKAMQARVGEVWWAVDRFFKKPARRSGKSQSATPRERSSRLSMLASKPSLFTSIYSGTPSGWRLEAAATFLRSSPPRLAVKPSSRATLEWSSGLIVETSTEPTRENSEELIVDVSLRSTPELLRELADDELFKSIEGASREPSVAVSIDERSLEPRVDVSLTPMDEFSRSLLILSSLIAVRENKHNIPL